MQIRWTKKAENDLFEILQHLISSNMIHIAESTSERIFIAIQKLGIFPNIGKTGRVMGTKELIMPDMPYIIVYAIDEKINILRIVHTARFWNA